MTFTTKPLKNINGPKIILELNPSYKGALKWLKPSTPSSAVATVIPHPEVKSALLAAIFQKEKDADWWAVGKSLGSIAQKQQWETLQLTIPAELNFDSFSAGLGLSFYQPHYKSTPLKGLKTVQVKRTKSSLSEASITQNNHKISAVNFARDLVDRPANYLTPQALAELAVNLAKKNSRFRCKIYDLSALKKMGAGGLVAVGKGAESEPYLIVWEYRGSAAKEPPIALVGKGVCFDSGGYNLKPSGHIETMKLDMGGAATVMGVMHYLQVAQPNWNVVGVIGAVENSVSSRAYRPGDILTLLSGTTTEVLNTDAEGRIILADCLHYAKERFSPACMIDFATLTGAVITALGSEITGIMGNNQRLLKRFAQAANKAEEAVWELPLAPEHQQKVRGKLADINNLGADGRAMGSTMGGAFLAHFVGQTPWLHCDIGGTAFLDKATERFPAGGTGALVRTTLQWLESEFSAENSAR